MQTQMIVTRSFEVAATLADRAPLAARWRDASSLHSLDHRLSPVATGKWLMAQTWQHVLFAHWPVQPALIRRMLPDGVEPDTFEHQAWLSVVAFDISDVHLRGWLALPGISRFPRDQPAHVRALRGSARRVVHQPRLPQPAGHRVGTTVVPVAVPLFAAVARGRRVHEPGPLGALRAGRRPLLRRARVTRPLADRALLLLHPRLARAPVSLRHSSRTVAAAACHGLDFPELARA